MLGALCVMGTLFGFSFAVNIVIFVAYGEKVKEIARMKVDTNWDALRDRIETDIEKSRSKLQEASE